MPSNMIRWHYIFAMKIISFPKFQQTYDWDCGVKAVQSILTYYGIDADAEDVMDIAGSREDSGTHPGGIKGVLHSYGLMFEEGQMSVKELKQFIDQKIPVIILLQAWADDPHVDWQDDWDDGHYVIAIGYDKKKMYFQDPSASHRTYLYYPELEMRWHDRDDDGTVYDHWGLAVFGKRPNFHFNKAIHMD